MPTHFKMYKNYYLSFQLRNDLNKSLLHHFHNRKPMYLYSFNIFLANLCTHSSVFFIILCHALYCHQLNHI